jgi:hypothetical protein
MALTSRHRGLCETCDYDATCTLKRSSRLEIIHCEQFSTQPVISKKTSVQTEVPFSAVPGGQGIVPRPVTSVSDEPINLSCGSGQKSESAKI